MGRMLTCAACGAVIRGKDDDEVMANGAQHGKEKHPDMEVTEEMAQQMRSQIKDE